MFERRIGGGFHGCECVKAEVLPPLSICTAPVYDVIGPLRGESDRFMFKSILLCLFVGDSIGEAYTRVFDELERVSEFVFACNLLELERYWNPLCTLSEGSSSSTTNSVSLLSSSELCGEISTRFLFVML